jgi:small-conductance mechanosensitive channel
MESGAPTLFDRFVSSESIGVSTAVVLVLALLVLLPRPVRRLGRQPLLFLFLHGLARAILSVAPPDTTLRKDVGFLSLILLLASVGRSGVLLVLDVGLGRRLAHPLPKIVRDIVQGLVYAAVLFAALHSSGVEPESILTTSALLTAGLAFALQETLGNMIAGLSIQVQRPFHVDDWIQFNADPKQVGKVLEINWRATKLLTLDLVEVIVPNSTLAKAAIINFTKPTPVSRRSIYVQVACEIPPHQVHRAILEGLAGSFGALPKPDPSVVTNAVADGNIEYWVRFFTDRFDARDEVDGSARDRIWYSLARAGIPLGIPRLLETSAEAIRHDASLRTSAHERALRGVDFLRVLPDEQLRKLAEEGCVRWYLEGEAVVKEGDQSSELFIIESGEVVVSRARQDGRHGELARLGAGHFFGEMALMMGERRNATVTAVVPSSLFVIGHSALKDSLASAPDLASHISRVMAERQVAVELDVDAGEPMSVDARSSMLLGRIQRFFAL